MVEFNIVAPTAGDRLLAGGGAPLDPSRRDPWNGKANRVPTLNYIQDFFREAERAGFDSILLGTGDSLLTDPLVSASAVISATERIKFLMAIRPGVTAPALFARQLAAIDHYSEGRALVNIVTGGSPADLAADGDFLDHSARYKRTREFVYLIRRLFEDEHVNHAGDYYRLENAFLELKSRDRSCPAIYLGGQSGSAMNVAAELADVYLMYSETLDSDHSRMRDIQARAASFGRTIETGITFIVVVGNTEEEALRKARALIPTGSEAADRKRDYVLSGESAGLKRLHTLMEGAKEQDYWLGPNRWAGLTQVTSGSSVTIVGTPDQVTDRIVEYAELGFTKFLFRGFPLLESARELGEHIIPRVQARLRAAAKEASL
ncbi:LLM class flavin-dependent oxidoreductase [Paenibacillus sp. MMO-177]|uniref:LLM class flavin-dependent oxidoreductase n=1 Tax=Paenibacillus sp. MMO-177 TaxID=3081289 RepID=UPI003018F2A6